MKNNVVSTALAMTESIAQLKGLERLFEDVQVKLGLLCEDMARAELPSMGSESLLRLRENHREVRMLAELVIHLVRQLNETQEEASAAGEDLLKQLGYNRSGFRTNGKELIHQFA
ncbi:hypothetical protein [Paenibacillus sp. y28]|uniref:hypothetical protein n=1 Tax=Paenibacillus sp. y28 TaxID=3129110 RepID=UPI00301B58E5